MYADGDGSCRIVNQDSGDVVASFQPMQQIWVELGADGSRAHGPTLQMHLVAKSHPLVKATESGPTSSSAHDSHQVRNSTMRFQIPKY